MAGSDQQWQEVVGVALTLKQRKATQRKTRQAGTDPVLVIHLGQREDARSLVLPHGAMDIRVGDRQQGGSERVLPARANAFRLK